MARGMSTDDNDFEIISDYQSAENDDADNDGKALTDLVEQPAKVMRIGTMIKQLLEEVRVAPLDDASRTKLREIHRTSIRELEEGLAPELREELERLALPFSDDVIPSDAELRIAQAQLEQMRQWALPPGAAGPGQRGPVSPPGTGQYL